MPQIHVPDMARVAEGTARETLSGFSQVRESKSATRRRQVTMAAKLYADVLQGRQLPVLLHEAMNPSTDFIVRHIAESYPGIYGDMGGRNLLGLRETMSVTDYQALFVDVLDRLYYGYYGTYPVVNRSLVKYQTLRDFRLVSRYLLDGMVSPFQPTDAAAPYTQRSLLGPAPQDGTAPPTNATSTAPLQYQPALWQAGAAINWRAYVNDDLGIFQDIAKRLSQAAVNGITQFITGFFFTSAGLNPALYNSGYGNIINEANGAASNNPPLSSQGVMDAIKIMAGMRDSQGNPILVNGRMRLFHPPALSAVAQNLKKALSLYVATEGGTQSSAGFPAQWLNVSNWLSDMDIVMDPWIPIVAAGSGFTNTAWGIVVDPESAPRPCVEVGFLTGYETPQVFTKLPNTQRLGGGVDPQLGDFYSMDTEFKIVSVFGGKVIDGRTTVASTGAGS